VDDFADFLAEVMPKYDRVLLAVEFNIHICCPDKEMVHFFNPIDSGVVCVGSYTTHER